MPEISDSGTWVRIGQQDDYFFNLIQLYKRSATHGACVNRISKFVYGKGLEPVVPSFDFEMFLRVLNPKEVKKYVFDKRLYGMGAFEIITNPLGNMIVSVRHLPFDRLRPESKQNGKIRAWYYNPDWADYQTANYTYSEPTRIPVWEGKENAGRFIYVDTNYTVGNEYLTPPDYESAIAEIQTEKEISDYHLTNVETGFSGTTLVQLNNGEPTVQQQQQFEQRFIQKYSGSRGHKVMFMYNNTPETAAQIDNIQLSDADKQYQLLDERNQQKILTAHGVTSPILIGIKTATGLGNNADEMRQAWEMMEALLIQPAQNDIIDFLSPIVEFNGYDFELKMESIPPYKVTQTTLSADTPLQKFINTGVRESRLLEDGFVLIEEEEVNELEDIKPNINLSVDSFGKSSLDFESKKNDGQWLVRYQYGLGKKYANSPEIIQTSRDFCREMIRTKYVYRKEDIMNLSNTEFGNYNIFWYKGSYNCRHVWTRKIYFKPNNQETPNPVGNVPYVVSRVNDKRATTNNKPSR